MAAAECALKYFDRDVPTLLSSERDSSYQAKIEKKIRMLGLYASELVTFAESKSAEHAILVRGHSAGRRLHDGLEQEAAKIAAMRAEGSLSRFEA
eukprot:6010771-Prymnesium_polylepis.1